MESPPKPGAIPAGSIFDSSARPDGDQQMPPPNTIQEQSDQQISQQSFGLTPRLSRCAKQIDDLYHKFDGCLEQIADIRAAKLFYESKSAEMSERLR